HSDLLSFPPRRSSDLFTLTDPVLTTLSPPGASKTWPPCTSSVPVDSAPLLNSRRLLAFQTLSVEPTLSVLLLIVTVPWPPDADADRKSTRLNSSHEWI